MKWNITGNNAYQRVEINIPTGDKVQIAAGSMIYHNGKVVLEGKLNTGDEEKKGLGGLLKAAARSVVTGESMFITQVTAQSDGAMISIAPPCPGEIKELKVGENMQWRIRDKAFLACDSTAAYKVVRQSLGKALFGGTGGLFIMETTGEGSFLIDSYGDMVEITLDGTAPFVVDNNHCVAWSASLDYQIEVASGNFGFLSGEGLVNKFSGRGTILIQTRNAESLANILKPFFPSNNS